MPPRYFRPPTHTEHHAPPGADRLWSRVPYQRANTVLNEGGTITAAPGLLVVDGDRLKNATTVWTGGIVYEVSGSEETALTAAGYGSYISDTPP